MVQRAVNPLETATIIAKRHASYIRMSTDWVKWRLAFKGGKDFVNKYLVKLSDRESDPELLARKTIAFAPSFGKAAINDIKNSVFQRVGDVHRVGGPKSYQNAILGLEGGVDFETSSMGEFVGTQLLAEMLIMQRVGVLVDNFTDLGSTLRDKSTKRPYLVRFVAEDILNWAPVRPINGFTALLLKETVTVDDEWGLPSTPITNYRLYNKVADGVRFRRFDPDGHILNDVMLDIEKIPFAMAEVDNSLLIDVADYQISLLNLESSDVSFATKANFTFYYEFFDPRTEQTFAKTALPNDTGTEAEAKTSAPKEIKLGQGQGRRIGKGLEKPGFISPDPDTLRVSMEKGEQLKKDIRNLLNLNLQSMSPRRQSASSQEFDSRSLESSLSFIGLLLQRLEREIGVHWRAFEGEGSEIQVTYPKTYNLKNDKDRRDEAGELEELQNKVPSAEFRKTISKKIATILVGGDIPEDTLKTIHKEIDTADTLTSDPQIILSSHEAGLVDDKTAAVAIGFKKDVVNQAKKDRAERIKLTLEAQGGPENADGDRGAPEFDKEKPDEKDGKKTRGEGAENQE
jgi:hypothetical protein